MKITLTGFRCHLDTELTIADGMITLLKGPSGIGKSTIFQAIFWCLYGSLRHIRNHNNSRDKCSVTLELNQIPFNINGSCEKLKIMRQKSPDLFRIYVIKENGTDIYEDKVAQKIIDTAYGTKELFLAACYLVQNGRSLLLTGTNAEKMDLLNKLSFNTEDPEEFINTIDEELNKIQAEFTSKQALFTQACDIFQRDINANNLDMSKFLNPQHRPALIQQLKEQQKLAKELEVKVLQQERALGIQSSLETTQIQLQKNLSQLRDVSNEEIILLEKELHDLTQQNPEQRECLLKELQLIQDKLQSIPPSSIQYSEKDLMEASLLQREYDTNISQCQKLGCPYDEESLNTEIKHLQNIIDIQPRLQAYSQILTVQAQLDKLKGPMATDEDILIAQDHLRKLQDSVNILKCPHCQKPVRFMNNTLIPGECEPASKDIILEASLHLNNLIEGRKRSLEIKNLNQQLDSLKVLVGDLHEHRDLKDLQVLKDMKSPIEILQMKERLTELSRIQVVKKPSESPHRIREILSRQQHLERREKLITELEKLPPISMNTKDMTIRIEWLRNEIKNLREIQATRKTLQQQLEDTREKLKQIHIDTTVRSQLVDIQKQIQENTYILNESEKIDIFLRRQTELEKEREELTNLHKTVVNLQQLKHLAVEIECHALQGTVDSINVSLMEITEKLFDDPISISLKLFKTLKTTQRVKPSVNISLNYKGGEFDTISELSGGECDRISLAITIALAKLHGAPFLLLDECLASLDTQLKETAVKTLRQQLGSQKTIICINHDSVEGIYDNIIGL